MVFIAPLEGTADGRISYDMPQASRGRWIRGVWVETKDGLLARFGASENEQELKESIGTKNKKMGLGYLTIGVNPEALPTFLDHQMAKGIVGVHFGNNETFGGKIKGADYWFGGFSRHATLEVDGRRLVDKGRIIT